MARKTIGVALSGGGARGFAHIGVLKGLVEGGVPIDFIAGTSAGSFVGAAFASGMPISEIERIAHLVGWFNMTGLSYSPRALLSNAAMANFIHQHFPVACIEDMPIGFAAVACDLSNGDGVVFKGSGDLATAVRASCAVPGVFSPVADDQGRLLIDGGVLAPVPVETVRAMGADVIVAVDLLACGNNFRSIPRTMVGMLFQSAMILLRASSRSQHYVADHVIIPEIAHIRQDELGKRGELIELGYAAGVEAVSRINEFADFAPFIPPQK